MRATPWLAGLAFIALGACTGDKVEGPAPVTPTERYSIEVRPAPQEMKLAAHTAGLSAAQADALRVFIGDWREAGAGDVTVKSPAHGPDPAGAYRTATDARDFLISQGVQPGRVHIVGYEADGDAHAPILVGFVSYEAKGPQCGKSWEDLSNVDNNREYAEFGCALTANVAAQIGTPADLLNPRPSDPPDAMRRQAVIDKYRQGAMTSTPADPQADGTFAKVGQ